MLLFLVACIENKLGTDPVDPVFDTGTTPTIPTEETDSGTTPVGEVCPDQLFPGYAGSGDGDCAAVISVGTFTPEVEWEMDSFAVEPSSNSVMMTPIVVSLTDDDGDGDADDDDTPDILFVTYVGTNWTSSGVLRAVSGDGSGELWAVDGEGLDGCSGLAAGDLDGDGFVEIIAVTTSKEVVAFEADGSTRWTSAAFTSDLGSYAPSPSISDMDGDGSPEIIVGRTILNADGTRRSTGPGGTATPGTYGSTAVAVDIDGDGTQELVVGNALSDPDGNVIWNNGQADGYVAVADFDHDGLGEIAVVQNGRVRLQDDDGAVLWDVVIPRATTGYGGPPTIADFDGDGEPEIGVAANSTYTVFEGDDGAVLWQTTTQDSSSGVTGSAVYDFEGDGIADVVYADETQLWVFNGVDGSVKLNSPDHSSWTVNEYAVIADVDGDDEAEIIVPRNIHPSYPSDALYGIAVFGDADHSWRPGRKIWNQHAYHITNVEDDGSLPRSPDLNWDTYNNFRSGDIEANTSTSTPDLTIAQADLCAIECDAGRLVVWVQPGNIGAADVLYPVDVDIYATESGVERWVATQTVVGPLLQSQFLASLQFELDGLDMPNLERLRVYIFPADDECDPDNNETAWEGPFCP